MNENLIPPRDPPLKIEPFFDYNGYQVVRGEFFAHKQEPSVTFYNGRISFNNACVRKMPDVTHVEIMVSRTEKKLLVRPGNEDEKDSIRWCNERNNARTISCSILYAMIYDLMNWNPDFRYKLLGTLIRSNGQRLFLFDLNAPEVYAYEEKPGKDKKLPFFPKDWKDQFGIPESEHARSLQVKTFEEYVTFGFTTTADKPQTKKEDKSP